MKYFTEVLYGNALWKLKNMTTNNEYNTKS